jgi:hypothetical protein
MQGEEVKEQCCKRFIVPLSRHCTSGRAMKKAAPENRNG